VHGPLVRQLGFPAWWGKTSTTNKKFRLLKEVHSHMSSHISGNKNEISLDYLPLLRNKLTTPLIERGFDGIQSIIDIMETYSLAREDWDTIIELSSWSNTEDLTRHIETQVKSSFTRQYKASEHAVIFAPTIIKGKTKNILYEVEEEVDVLEEEDEEEKKDDDISSDKLIKQKKKKSIKAKTKKKAKK